MNNISLSYTLDEVENLFSFNIEQSYHTFSNDLKGLTTPPNGMKQMDKYLNIYTTLTNQDLIHFDTKVCTSKTFVENRFAFVSDAYILKINPTDTSKALKIIKQ